MLRFIFDFFKNFYKLHFILQINRSHLSELDRATVIKLKNSGWTYKAIAVKMERNISTIQKIYKQFKLNGSHKKPTRASHHRVTTSTDDAAILNAVREWPETTSNSLIGELNLVASARTVRRRLRDAGLNRKDTLLPWHVEERYEFANSYLDKQHTPDFWSKVIFVDERTFTTYNSKYVQIINHKQSGILGYRKFLY